MKTLIVDTNIFLRFLLKDIPTQYEQSKELLQLAQNEKLRLIVPQIIIFEIHFALSKYYSFEKEKVIESLQSILSADYLDIESRDIFLLALTIFQDKTLSLVDCFLIAKSKIEKIKVKTLDKELIKAILV